MNCPNCKAVLNEFKLGNKISGMSVKVDQCLNCGGIWFDAFEMYQLSPESTNKLKDLNFQKLNEMVSINEKHFCPRDRILLEKFEDINMPQDIFIERCSQCGGFWVNHGEYKDWLQSRLKQKLEQKDKQDLEIPSLHSRRGFDDLLGSVSDFLMQPVRHDGSIIEINPAKPYSLNANQIALLKSVPSGEKAEIYKSMINENGNILSTNKNIGSAVARTIIIMLRSLFN